MTIACILLLPAAPAQAFGISSFDVAVSAEGGAPDTEAGGHPVAVRMSVDFEEGTGDLRDLSLELPPGLFENPTVAPQCTLAAFETPRESPWEESRSGESCPDRSQVGTLTLRSSYGVGETRTFGLFNLAPPPGAPAELGANPYGAPIVFVPEIRQSEGEYGIALETRNVPQLVSVEGLEATIWGTPGALLHNAQRGNCLNESEPGFGWAKCPPGNEGGPHAYLTLPTSCEGPLPFTARAVSWQGVGATDSDSAPALEGCSSLRFEPHPRGQLSDPRASSPSGYAFEIATDTTGVIEPRFTAPSPVRKAVVSLPKGVSVNPSVGAGLGVCTTAQYEAETPSSPAGAGCPNQSKIGDFSVKSPIVAGEIEGSIFLAAPRDNPFGSLIAIYLVAKSIDRGVLVKVAGRLDADPADGSLTATFDRLPQLPYSNLLVHFREGQRSPLATPPACGTLPGSVQLTPWRDATLVKSFSLPAQITAGVGGGPCPQGAAPFAPKASGGSLNSQAGAYSSFYLHLTRTDVEQEIVSYSASFPPGLLGKIAGIPFCPDAAIEAAARRSGVEEREDPSCPAASLIGHTTAGYGVGTVPTYAPGNLYLAGPYRGSELSVVAIDSALVGPFDLGVVIVRSAIRIDPSTAQATIDATGTDPIPHIVEGIPIHLRDVRVYVDRPQFTLNPTSCDPFAISSALNGAGQRFGDPSDDSLATATARYQAFNCGALGFRPRLAISLRGKTRHGGHPSLRVVVRPRPGDANIAAAAVTLPPSLFLDQEHIRSVCTRVQFASDHCPNGSVYGHVRARTPLLEKPMEGPVYLRSSDGTLPDLVFVLRGSGVEVDLAGRIDSSHGGIRGSFPTIPDAPVSRFELTMPGGRRGLLQVSAPHGLCARPRFAGSRFVGHNDRGLVSRPRVGVSCG